MMPFSESASLLPLSPAASTIDQLAILSRVKNALIGKRERKLEVLRGGAVPSLTKLMRVPSGTEEDVYNISIQTAVILGALSLPIPESMMVLLSAGVHTTLLHALTELSRPHLLGEGPILLLRSKLLETLLRSVKMLYVDLVKVVGPRAWGCSVIGACVALDEPRDVRLPWEVEAAAKGKGRETAAMEGLEGTGPSSKNVSSLAVLAETAIRDLYDLREVHEDADAPGPSTPTSSHTKRAPSAALGFLLRLLEDCSQSSGSSWRAGSLLASESSRFRLADMICQLIAGTVRLGYQRAAVLGEPEVIAEALHRVIEHGHGKVREAALYALSALTRDHRRFALVATRTAGGKLGDLITELTQSPSASLRLAAATCQTILYKTLLDRHRTSAIAAEPLVPILLSLLESEPDLHAQASFAFAHLVADNESLQNCAVKLKCLEIISDVLKAPPRVSQPYQTPSSLEESARIQEGCLLSIAVLSASSNSHRNQVLLTGLLPTVVASLSHPFASVRAAACHVIRSLARSVSVVRTTLVEAGAAGPIYALLGEDEDVVVQICASAAASNLLLEFSPMREILIAQGCIQRLCELAKSGNESLKMSALFAIKNAVYQSEAAFKRSTARELGWSYLGDCINDPKEDIAIEALGILRNLTCTVNNDPVSGLAEIGEERMLSLLEIGLTSKSNRIVNESIFTLVNLSTADEVTKLAIVKRNNLLRSLLALFEHPTSEIRCGAVWVFVNLAFHERTPLRRRKPFEIVSRLRALGVEQRLRAMSGDVSLDVRERVKDALETMALTA